MQPLTRRMRDAATAAAWRQARQLLPIADLLLLTDRPVRVDRDPGGAVHFRLTQPSRQAVADMAHALYGDRLPAEDRLGLRDAAYLVTGTSPDHTRTPSGTAYVPAGYRYATAIARSGVTTALRQELPMMRWRRHPSGYLTPIVCIRAIDRLITTERAQP